MLDVVAVPVQSARKRITLTMVFTDIAGSTRLLSALGDAWGDVLSRHHALARTALDRHGGTEVDSAGDGFFFTFRDAAAAVGFAADFQRGLTAEPWPPGVSVQVRMGIHTGTVEYGATGLIGMDVHKAARVASAGHGGQVLVTAATRELLTLTRLRDLGTHRLKDVPNPIQIYQLDIDGLPGDFPPIRSADARRVVLPPARAALRGRDAELVHLRGLLAGTGRLTTLVGPGGAGKTVLALHAARLHVEDSRDAVVHVALAGVTDPSGVLPAIALALEAEQGEDVIAAVTAALQGPTLLLLDNVEQVLAAASDLAALLAAAPELRLLITSRAPLRLSGEQLVHVETLALPASDRLADVLASPAVQLFAERARAQRPDFAVSADNAGSVAALTRALDGLPLALELAAARVRTLPVQQLLQRLAGGVGVLRSAARDIADRQRSLQATIDWSVDLLPPDAVELFVALGCFEGGWTLELLEEVYDEAGRDRLEALDALEALIEMSLVRAADDDGRFTWSASVRDAARARMTDQTWHRAHAAVLTRQAADETRHTPAERDNLRRALAWAEAHDRAAHARLVGHAVPWLEDLVDQPLEELLRHVELARAVPDLDDETAARLAESLSRLSYYWGTDADVAVAAADQAVALRRGLSEPVALALALCTRALVAVRVEDLDALCGEATTLLSVAARDDLAYHPVFAEAQVRIACGDADGARPLVRRLDELADTNPEPMITLARLHFGADLVLLAGDGTEAVRRYADAVRNALATGNVRQGATELEGMAQGLALCGRLEDALVLLSGAASLRTALGAALHIAWWDAMIERNVRRPAQALSADVVEAARSRGTALGPEGIIDYALGMADTLS